jgi:hypothetical protein
VAACAERRDVGWREILHLIDEHRHPNANICRQAGHIGEQLQQVDLHVSGVGAANRRRTIDRRRPALDQLAAAWIATQPERLQCGQHITHPIRRAVPY